MLVLADKVDKSETFFAGERRSEAFEGIFRWGVARGRGWRRSRFERGDVRDRAAAEEAQGEVELLARDPAQLGAEPSGLPHAFAQAIAKGLAALLILTGIQIVSFGFLADMKN